MMQDDIRESTGMARYKIGVTVKWLRHKNGKNSPFFDLSRKQNKSV